MSTFYGSYVNVWEERNVPREYVCDCNMLPRVWPNLNQGCLQRGGEQQRQLHQLPLQNEPESLVRKIFRLPAETSSIYNKVEAFTIQNTKISQSIELVNNQIRAARKSYIIDQCDEI